MSRRSSPGFAPWRSMPDADVLDDGGDAGLAQVGRARAEGELPVGAQVPVLEQAVAAAVIAGQVVHVLLPEDEQAVESSLGHRPASPAPSRRPLPPRALG